MWKIALGICFFLLILRVNGQTGSSDVKKSYTTTFIQQSAPKIDGHLDDACWAGGNWAGNFVQRSPHGGSEPSQTTEFKILYDEKNLYIAFRCYDTEPTKITYQVGRRDQLKGDAVGIAFDSYYDKRTAFEFDVTAAGGKVDMIGVDNGQSWQFSWDAVWFAKTSITDWGWIAELQIPFSQLRFPKKEQYVWGMHVTRRIYRLNEEDNWNLIPSDAPGMMHLFAQLNGLKNISPGKKLEILPYISGSQHFYEPVTGNPYSTGKDFSYNAGFDAKIALSSNFTMDVTVNPDFGQVEADPSELNLTVFETFFEEKRPFFIEGKNLLETNFGVARLFYSRRIGSSPGHTPKIGSDEYIDIPDKTSIIGSVKISGKTKNGLSVGVLQSLTSKEYARIKDVNKIERKEVAEPMTNYFVAKVQKDINKGNTVIGGTVTSTNRLLDKDYLDGMAQSAFTGGLNFLHQWKDKTYYVSVTNAVSSIHGSSTSITKMQYSPLRFYQRPDAEHIKIDSSLTSLNGYSGEFTIGKAGNGRYKFYERFRWVSPGFDANDLGFLSQSDYFEQKSIVLYENNTPAYFYNTITGAAAQYSYWDFGGGNLYNMAELSGGIKFSNLWKVNSSLLYFYHQSDVKMLRGGEKITIPDKVTFNIWGNSNAQKKLSFSANYLKHKYFDNKSSQDAIQFGINYDMNSRIDLNIQSKYIGDDINFQYVAKSGNDFVLAHLDRKTYYITMRFGVYLTPEISMQYYAMPYFSTGKYSGFKRVMQPGHNDYEKQFHIYSENEIQYDALENKYTLTNTNTGTQSSINNPDFRFQELRSNFVFRWEFRPSSVFYVVWSHSRSENKRAFIQTLDFNEIDLFDIYPDNVFMIKLNYWFSI